MSQSATDGTGAQVPVTLSVDPFCTLDPNCAMVPGKGPFARAYAEYRAAGWLGTLRLPKLSKSPVPTGFTGDKGEWPEDSRLHGWSHESATNIGLRVPDDVIAIDVDQYDDKKGAEQLEELEKKWGALPPTWMSSARGFGPSGKRFYRVPAGVHWPTDPAPDIEVIQFRHRYAVVWPSEVRDKNDSDLIRVETWYDPEGVASGRVPHIDALPTLPVGWVTGLKSHKSTGHKSATATEADMPDPVSIPSEVDAAKPWYVNAMVSPNARGRGNDNSLSIAGGVANLFVSRGIPYEVALAVVLNYERASRNPQSDAVVQDQLRRMWAKEQAKLRELGNATFNESTGYLIERTDNHFGYQTVREFMGKKGPETEPVPFSDFQVQATSVNSVDGQTMWTVDLIRDDGLVFQDVDLPDTTLASTAALRRWAMGYQCSLFFTDDRARQGGPGIRLQKLLRSQNPVNRRVISHLGWDELSNGFVTYQGLITANGVAPDAPVRPAKNLEANNLVNHNYGFRPEKEVREVLREVLTFHDETFTSVFGSWMVAGVIKGLLMQRSSLFPIFLVQAASESGKSKGFSQLIHQMFGNKTKEGGIGTKASIRDAMTAHRGAPVHIDDADNVDDIKEILRQATVEGSTDKKGDDNRSNVRARLLAPVWISMEGSSLLEDKALSDRIVAMSLPNPKGRRSLKDPARPQWDDILDLMNKYNGADGLTVFSGTLVQMILRRAAKYLADFAALRTRGVSSDSGRHADKMAVLRLGARILADITRDGEHIRRVDAWVDGQHDSGDENALTLKLMPAAILALDVPSTPIRINSGAHHNIVSPLIYCRAPGDSTGPKSLWVHIDSLAMWWEQRQRGRIEERTETKAALADQAARVGMRGGKTGERNKDWAQFGVVGTVADGGRSRSRYIRVPTEVTEVVLERIGVEIHTGEIEGKGLNLAQMVSVERSSMN